MRSAVSPASRRLSRARLALAILALSASAFAQTITGTVTNGTTGKPAANAEVVLLELAEGMQEAARTRTTADGRFSLAGKTPSAPHLIRVEHGGVNYHKMAPPGVTTADVTIYDTTTKHDGIIVSVENAYESHEGHLSAVQFITARNATNRTVAGDSTLEITLPPGSKIASAQAQTANGQPITAPHEEKGNGRVSFSYPLRPGDTIFQVGYEVPYTGELAVAPKIDYPVEQMAVILPPSMKFQAATPGLYQPEQHASGVNIQIAGTPGARDVSYRISGTGSLPQASEMAQAGGEGDAGVEGRGPGGGLGAPINSPDPLFQYRWPLLGGLSAMLALAALFFVARRGSTAPATPNGRPSSMSAPSVDATNTAVARNAATSSVHYSQNDALLAALKEELFQLETERSSGRITAEEYASAKAALDATLQRALSRRSTPDNVIASA